MSDEQINERDEARLAAMLRALDADAAAVDRQAIDALHERAAQVFDATDHGSAAERSQPEVVRLVSPQVTTRPKRRSMNSLLMRGMIAVGGLAAAIAVCLNLVGPPKLTGAAPFSKVLDELRAQETLELKVTKDGKSADVWIRAPGLVRWQDSPQQYKIAAGSRLWKIDEAANTVTTGDSPWFINPQQQVDLVGLLQVGVTDSGPLLNARAIDRTEFDGRDCFVYRVDLSAKPGPIEIAAYADAKSKQLVGLVAQPAGGAANAAPPLAELHLVAMNARVDESKFVVAKSLTDDGRIGKVSDAQGVVVVRPALAQRWTPVGPEVPLRTGDWLRTDVRGANAVRVRLSSNVELTLGPGTLVECISPVLARLHTGEVQVNLPKQETPQFELLAPREGSRKFAEPGKKSIVLLDRSEKLADVKQPPKWLRGFEGASADESLGSLVVDIDGRSVPLSVGYHKVSVEIRDQIARTTIEESFVNNTTARLEGVFHFPLPQDASISDFGMWIGNNLVEADVVEKQRAREIYETILRERRDPGLLEWTGGNIFKARVFPIEPSSEKRIKIVYTQVLPLRANKYRYTYALRSELLRMKPLRELSLTVTLNSALPLKSVTCPTHTARVNETAHSAQVVFAAQEYSPTRDFEVVCEVDGRQSDVVVIPHRRGDDGYFIVQLTPPGPEGNWQRELVADGKPLELVLLCDTSASMDGEKRKQQAEFVATVLASLGEKDRFWLAGADVTTVWASKEPLAATAENIAKARDFLEHRLSLGWTNLEQAFEAVAKKAPAGAQVIYIGDGIVTAGRADPVDFVNRLGRMFGEDQKGDKQAGGKPVGGAEHRVFHAVTVGNSFESTVLKAIASVGGGSVRSIGGEQTPQSVGLELLKEITSPGLRDLNIEFRGLKVAAVYPDRLPNLAAGTQLILVGRYLPTGKDQQGEIVVTGRRGSEAVRYAAKIDLKDAESGNSFIPRLWARAHLDHLLAQGQSQAVRDQIIALSEEFHIITSYTSLLVLETDADRERFGVKRRFAMRNGEQFFAAGHDNANFELTQQQMKWAGDWRIGLRRQVLAMLARQGRNPRMFERQRRLRGMNMYEGPMGGGIAGNGEMDRLSELAAAAGPSSWGGGGGSGDDFASSEFRSLDGLESAKGLELGEVNGPLDEGREYFGRRLDEPESADRKAGDFDVDDREELDIGLKDGLNVAQQAADSRYGFIADETAEGLSMPASSTPGLLSDSFESPTLGKAMKYRGLDGEDSFFLHRPFGYGPNYTAWLDTLFPSLAPPDRTPPAPKKSPDDWSPEAIDLARRLSRIESLKKLEGGIELRTTSETFDPRWKRRTSRHRDLALYSPNNWLTRSLDLGTHTIVNYCDAKERGIFSLSLLLGRLRKTVDRDLSTPPLSLADLSLTRIDEAYRGYEARVVKGDAADQMVLILKAKGSDYEQRLTIDTSRHVLLKIETVDRGKVSGTTTFSDFEQIAGMWWGRRVVVTDEKGRKIGETTLDIGAIAPAKYSERIAAELTAKPRVQFLHLPLPRLKDAQQRVADGSAGFDDRIAMMLHDSVLQQWDELLKQLDTIEKTAADKPGIRWLRPILWVTIRRNDEARGRLLEEARKLAETKQQDEQYLAGFLLSQAQGVTSPAEYLEFVERLKPVFDRQPAELDAKDQWQEQLAGAYDRLGRTEDALAIKRALAEQAPWDVNRQTDYARRLSQTGRPAAAHEWLDKQLARPEERTASEDESLRTTVADLYRSEGRWEDLLKFTTAWIERKPESQAAYQQHLAALVYNDRLDDANALAERWLKEAQIEGPFTADQTVRLEAAITFAQGSAYDLSFYRMDERWFEPLAQAIRYFARSKGKFPYVGRIMDYRFDQSDASDQVRGDFLKLLETEVDKLSPEQINGLVGRTLFGRIELAEPINVRKQLSASEIPESVWKKIAERIYARWQDTSAKKAAGEKHQLGEALRSIYVTRFDDKLLPFLRERIAAAEKDYKTTYISNLFDTLLSRPWTEKVEIEAFALLPSLTDADEGGDRLMVEVPALYRLVDAMIANRQNAALQELRDKGGVDKLTRTELAKKKTEFRKAAQEGVAKRLADVAAEEKNSGPVAAWLRIERAYLDLSLDQRRVEVEAECWKILGDAPPKQDLDAEAAEEMSPAKIRERFFESVLRNRAFVTVMNLAARKNAASAEIDRLIKYIDAGIALGADQAGPWRTAKFQLLVALDRPDDLERELRQWIRADVSTAPWRKALAMLLAERGKFDEPISLFEAAEKDHLLTAGDYRTLADWYLIVNRREAHDRARIEGFKQIPEHILANSFYAIRSRWLRTDLPLPSELDENTLLAMKALFEKSAAPENYLWQLRELYTACRDFRLLQMLPDAVLGRSPQQIYSFLLNLQSQLLGEIHNESTTDEIVARIKKLRDGKLTPTDLRALDLFEAVIERHAAEVLNQRGPHVEASLAALKRAFDRPWGEGEPRLMAGFLRSLNKLPDPKLIDEQLRELKVLTEKAPAGGRDHLEIVKSLAELLFWTYDRHNEALAQMEIEVRSYEQAHDGHWPFLDDEALGSYISMLEGAHQYAAGETLLVKYSAKPEHEQQKTWLENRLMQLYNATIEGDGEVSLGRGSELFAAVLKEHLQRIDAAADENERYTVVGSLVSTFEIAHRHKLSGVAESLRTFAFERIPAILKRQHAQYQNTANVPRAVIETVLGPRSALQYVIERMEQYPQWLEIGWQNSWATFGNEMARLREAAAGSKANIEDLEPRALKLTIRELKRDLRTGEHRAPDIYFVGHPYYWAAKAGDFAKAAEEVYREHKSSGRRVMYVANYLWGGLVLQPRAIEMLLAAHRDGVLDEGERMQLVEYLQLARRYGESIAILEPLVKFNPRAMNYRTRLMAAYFHTQQPEQLAQLVAETDKYFHKEGLWNEGNIAEFGHGALECRLLENAVGYLKEAIALHQRANPVANGDAGLSTMYQQLADAYSGLRKTKEAVDAASGAIVCWGPHISQRADAIRKLGEVLAASNDLDAFLKDLDKETAESKQDNPIVRKALGQTYQAKGKFEKAIVQLKIAAELQPNDVETHQALIACYDAAGQKREATLELLALIDLDRHNLALYQQLAERMKNDEAEAERAATSIIEAGPHEAENQAAIAELRQKQGRWNEAIEHWREAAELRRLEPTNLIKLIEAELHAKHWTAARESLDKLQKTEWPSRFNNVPNDIRRLVNELPKERGR